MGETTNNTDVKSALTDIKNGFVILCATVFCVTVFYIQFYGSSSDVLPLSFKIQKSSQDTQKPTHMFGGRLVLGLPPLNSSVFQTYLQIQKNYNSRLAALRQNKYKPSSEFIHYGDPVAKFVPKDSPKVKKILMWTSFFGNRQFIPKTLNCPGNFNCVSSNNRADLLSSDAVVVHARDIHGPRDLPTQRLPHQRWVHFLMESPYHAGINFNQFNGVYNWTATYRLDSDTPVTYSTMHRREKTLTEHEYSDVLTEIMDSKSKLVSSMISNCNTPHSPRLPYLREVEKHIPLDMYGQCGKLECPKTADCGNILKSYKFHMSFENSQCRDYISEKAGIPLYNWRSVPVVMGGTDPRDYEALLPPGSYIHTLGFESPKHLAEYLLLLDKNPALYEKYHEWRKKYTGVVYEFDVWCKVCAKLYNLSSPVQTYTNLAGWQKEDACSN